MAGVCGDGATTREGDDDPQIDGAVAALRRGGVIAIPTDTVYGLAAALDRRDALRRIYAIKGRSGDKALPILVAGPEELSRFSREVSPAVRALADAFWPGALTIVVPATADVPSEVTRGGDTVGLRMPDHSLALAVIRAAGRALAVTSANRSGGLEARTAEEVHERLGNRVAFVVDGGRSGDGPASTVVDATVVPFRILRLGAIGQDDIQRALSAVGISDSDA